MTQTDVYSEAFLVFLGFYQKKKNISFKNEIKQGKNKEKADSTKSSE